MAVKANEYKSLLHGLSLTDKSLARHSSYNWKNTLILFIGLIPFMIGAILNLPPALLANYISKKKVRKIEFGSSVRFAVGLFGWMIYFVILSLLLNAVGWHWWMILAIPFLGYFSLVWFDLFRVWNGARNYRDLPESVKEEFVEIRDLLLDVVNE